MSIILQILPVTCLLSGLLVITSASPVTSVLYLISVFIQVSAYLCLNGLIFLGLSYLIVYVGAIAILFLFVVMMLDLQIVRNKPSNVNTSYKLYTILALVSTSILIYLLITLLEKYTVFANTSIHLSSIYSDTNNCMQSTEQIALVGHILYGPGAFSFLLLSILLLIGLFGPILLSKIQSAVDIEK